MSTSQPTFNPLPAWSEPFVITPEARVRFLRSLLLDKSQDYQRKNILCLIQLYETGQLKELRPGKITWIFEGKAVDSKPKEIPQGSALWAEPLTMQMTQSASYSLQSVWNMHDPNIILDVSIMNDTGSNIQTIFTTDLAALGYDRDTRDGPVPSLSQQLVGIKCEQMFLGMQIIKADGTTVSPWLKKLLLLLLHSLESRRVGSLEQQCVTSFILQLHLETQLSML
ncbi:hypothetical protein V1517DRAFT_336105 [Lipomyces orientalis]|uniref:Uncharacterized protein n=1 Tax=Lipomyces orientalis TaxID=1233043 RepID=A0ACC3TX03_9ASCO